MYDVAELEGGFNFTIIRTGVEAMSHQTQWDEQSSTRCLLSLSVLPPVCQPAGLLLAV